MVGPDYHSMRRFLACVLSIVTDYGTEHKIVDAPDYLCPFLDYLGVPLPVGAEVFEFLFPVAVGSPGWGHVCDGLLRFLLCSYIWFPAWLRDFKALCKFIHLHSQDLSELFDAAQHPGSASVLRLATVRRFAEWRWGTLHASWKTFSDGLLDVLRNEVKLIEAYMRNMKDTVMAAGALRALTDPDWSKVSLFVGWSAREVTHLQTWGGWCMCHEEEHERGEVVDCINKGRNLPWAWEKVNDTFESMVKYTLEWSAHDFNGDHDLLQSIRGGVSALKSRGQCTPQATHLLRRDHSVFFYMLIFQSPDYYKL